MIERWSLIEGYSLSYAISENGKVKSLSTGKILKPAVNHKGYLIVQLCKNGERKNKRIHRLVAEAFLPNPDNLPEVDHINGKRQDNNVLNLRWVSGSTNTRNREVCRKASSKYNGVHWNSKLGKWRVTIWFDRKTKFLGHYISETEAALTFNNFCIKNNLNRELNKISEDYNGCNTETSGSRAS